MVFCFMVLYSVFAAPPPQLRAHVVIVGPPSLPRDACVRLAARLFGQDIRTVEASTLARDDRGVMCRSPE